MRGAEWVEKRGTSINGCQAGLAVAQAMPGQQQIANVSGGSEHAQTCTHTHMTCSYTTKTPTCLGVSLLSPLQPGLSQWADMLQ